MWTMVLEDGARHPVSGDIRFKIVGGSKVLIGTLEPTDPLFDAITEPAVMMISNRGEVHWITILSIDSEGAAFEGTRRPSTA